MTNLSPDSSWPFLDSARYTAREHNRNTEQRMFGRGDGPPPAMPADVWVNASRRYIGIYERLTGRPFEPGAYPVAPRLTENLTRAGLLT